MAYQSYPLNFIYIWMQVLVSVASTYDIIVRYCNYIGHKCISPSHQFHIISQRCYISKICIFIVTTLCCICEDFQAFNYILIVDIKSSLTDQWFTFMPLHVFLYSNTWEFYLVHKLLKYLIVKNMQILLRHVQIRSKIIEANPTRAWYLILSDM